ncbi:MAG TPA: hypothetical protein VGM77_13495 [Gemmatimonadales bacterium]|jgi:intracellular sulfur oxidation DsrE/DsrF family protein
MDNATGRRHFLGKLSSLSVATPILQLVDPLAAIGRAGSWDDSWTTRLGNSHRIVFDCPQPDEQALSNVSEVMDLYHDALGTTDHDVHCVVVVRFRALPMVFNDALWKELRLGASARINAPGTATSADHNFYTTSTGNRAGIVDLQRRGVTFLACNRAAMHYADDLKSGSADEKQQHIRDALLPGVILQPTGIYALIRAQDAGCVKYPV